MRIRLLYLFFAAFFLFGTVPLFSAEFIVKDINETSKKASWIALPYMFSSDTTGLTGGIVGIFDGYIQPQATVVATVYGGEKLPVKQYNRETHTLYDNGSARTKGVFLGISGYKLPFSKRLFTSAMLSYAYYPYQRFYINGSNDSNRELSTDTLSLTPIQTHGFNNWASVNMRYVLPWGESKNNPLPLIKLKNGLQVNRDNIGGGLPFVTGQTLIGVEYFYSHLRIDKIDNMPELSSNGLRFYLKHDNTDYSDNPSRGYKFELKSSFDFGWINSTQSWNAVEASYSHFIRTQKFSWSRHNVLAFNFWTAYAPSWQKKDDNTTLYDPHRPPMWEGAHLGGWDRLRGYDSNRFNDKAALYGGMEYRMVLKQNPLKAKKWAPIPIDWFQAVVFAEAGRVHSDYQIEQLLQNMKYDVGFSLRALAAKLPVRFDMGFSAEGSSMWVMIKQPF